jgi:hypothetical protein
MPVHRTVKNALIRRKQLLYEKQIKKPFREQHSTLQSHDTAEDFLLEPFEISNQVIVFPTAVKFGALQFSKDRPCYLTWVTSMWIKPAFICGGLKTSPCFFLGKHFFISDLNSLVFSQLQREDR